MTRIDIGGSEHSASSAQQASAGRGSIRLTGCPCRHTGGGQPAHNPQLNAYLAAGSFSRAMSRSSTMSGVTVYADAHEELPDGRCGCYPNRAESAHGVAARNAHGVIVLVTRR